MPKITIDDIEINCNHIDDVRDVLKKELDDGTKKLQKVQEEERTLSRKLRKIQGFLDAKAVEKKLGSGEPLRRSLAGAGSAS